LKFLQSEDRDNTNQILLDETEEKEKYISEKNKQEGIEGIDQNINKIDSKGLTFFKKNNQ
jgi:hypothetical protein